MTKGLKVIIYPVKDIAKAKTFYGALFGAAPTVDAPYYVQFNAGAEEIGLDPHGHAQGMTGAVPFWRVSDIESSVAQLVGAGATVQREVKDVGGGMRTALLRDADGNVTGVLQES